MITPEAFLSIIQKHGLYKMQNTILSTCIKNEDIKNYFYEQINIYKNKSNDVFSTGFKEDIETRETKKFKLNNSIDLTITSNLNFSKSTFVNSHLTLNSNLLFYFENKNINKTQSFSLIFTYSFFEGRKDLTSKLIMNYLSSNGGQKCEEITIENNANKIISIQLGRFFMYSKREKNKFSYNYDNLPELSKLSESDFKDFLYFGGFTQEKIDIMSLTQDINSFSDYVVDGKKTIFDILNESKMNIIKTNKLSR